MKKLFPLLLGIFLLAQAYPQEQLGLRTENLAGINGALLNPAAPLTAPFPWQVNLLEAGFFMENNYGYLERTNLPDLLGRTDNFNVLYGPDLSGDAPPASDDLIFYPESGSGRRFATIYSSAMGPSFFVRVGPGHSIGLTTRARSRLHVRRVSPNLSYDRLNAQPYFEELPVEPLQAGLLTWNELGLNAVFRIPVRSGRLGIGFTGKYLTGYEAAYVRVDSDFGITKIAADSSLISPFSVRAGYTTSNLSGDNFNLQNNGSGLGLDLGLVYADEGEGGAPYRWRVGVSILDLGGIRFDRNARSHAVRTKEPRALVAAPYESLEGIEDLDTLFRVFSEQTLGDPEASLQPEDGFFMWLPTAVSVQVDRAFSPTLFLNATLVQGIPLGDGQAGRGALLGLTPRWEHQWFGIAAPVTLYNWDQLNVGLGVRLGFLYLGSENLGSLLGRSRFSGTDFYAALRFHPWWRGNNEGDSRTRKRRNRGQGVECYRF